MSIHSWRERHGFIVCAGRWRMEFYYWGFHFGLGVGRSDDGWHGHVRVPPLSLFVRWSRWPCWTDAREFSIAIHDWTVRLSVWSRYNEWRARDPWWVRGVSLDLKDLIGGKTRYTCEVVAEGLPCTVPMPEGVYAATAKVERRTWKRPRWFRSVDTSVWLEIPKGIPHAGKGENSWDCGDDGLFGIGGSSVEDAIRRAQESVTRRRQRYGAASDDAIRRALAGAVDG